ncbi:MAG: hypothetical protein IT355_07640 [Gemmatimonadaceae bacterium]|nr:hypothetical protein [Gemmatimonadaceae bacterium]
MPQQTPADVRAPASATPAPGQSGETPVPAATPTPISREQAEFLRARRTALSNQLESTQERRDEVAEQLRDSDTQASERPGLESRLKVLDDRLVQLEGDIARNSQQLANAPASSNRTATGTTAPARRDRPFNGFNPNLVTILGFAMLFPLVFQFARRIFSPDRGPRVDRQLAAEQAAMNERMLRLESAIDAVSIEVERIGEGQRFLTQAMTDPVEARLHGGLVPEPMSVRARGAIDPA